MGMGEIIGIGLEKFIPTSWGIAARLCDTCKSTVAVLYCRVDSMFLCIGCDAKVHRNKHGHSHARVWMCEVCEHAPASVTCKADAAALCVSCDRDIHSANPLARRHERVPVVPFYDTAEAEAKSAAAIDGFLVDDVAAEIGDTAAAATHTCFADDGLLPHVSAKFIEEEPLELKGVELLFSESDQFLDFDNYQGMDSVVPNQPVMKSYESSAMLNQSPNKYSEIDFTGSKFNAIGHTHRFAAQSLGQSMSSSSMDFGVVPDGSSMSDISCPFGQTGTNTTDQTGSITTTPLQGSDREARVNRYREKRKNRKFEKTIRYASRKAYAETRPRIKGRFAKRTDTKPVNRMLFSETPVYMAESYGIVPSF